MKTQLKHQNGEAALEHPYPPKKDMGMRIASYFKTLWRDCKRDRYLYLLLIPFIAFFVIFQYKPLYGLVIAFKDYSLFKGIAASPWVGLENFKTFFNSPNFVRVFRNTVIINLYGLLIGFPIPIILALMFNSVRNKAFRSITQTLTYLPHFVSIVVVAGIVVNFLSPSHGMVNMLIEKLGGEKIYFLTKPQYFRGIFTGMNIWKESGFGAVIYIAALAGIDVQLYEAAYVDGANAWQRLRHITIPGILPTITIMLILRIGRMLEVGYEAILLLYQPATYETADVISTYVYRSAIELGNYSLATAAELFNAVVAIALIYGANRFARKFSETSLW